MFFITAASFAALSLWGYTTKRDLSGMGSFLIMGLFGIIIAMLVNLFLQSTMISFVVSVLGVLIFAGLTAYDTQKIKEMYYATDSSEIAGKKAVMGALKLYLDFLNMFRLPDASVGCRARLADAIRSHVFPAPGSTRFRVLFRGVGSPPAEKTP